MARDSPPEYDRVDQETSHNKENGDKEGISKEFQLLFDRLVFDRTIHCKSSEECAYDAGEIDGIGQDTGHGHDSKHQHKLRILIVFHLLERPLSHAAEAKENERDENGDLDQLQRQLG